MFGYGSNNSDALGPVEGDKKEWRLIERVVMANTIELRRSRRWGIFFKLLTFIYILAVLVLFIINSAGSTSIGKTGGHVAVIDIEGTIASGELAGADAVIGSLSAALQHPDTKAVILRINSPGGSPVQSAYIFNEIQRQRALNEHIPIYSVIVDSGASGAYYIAAATQEIYASGASIVGSIGVTAAGFGYQELMDKVGIERRQFTSGDHKAFLDPFSVLNPDEQALFEILLNDVHAQFIRDVKLGRGDRLVDSPKLFSGLFWTGSQALELGLIDGLKSTAELARELGYPQTVDFSLRPSPLEAFARNLGVSLAQALVKLGVSQGVTLN
ncbi:MAG: S49 family peptidase [Reinekea forsetii]|nr:S49 family peptidase [Reinekea forsetii]